MAVYPSVAAAAAAAARQRPRSGRRGGEWRVYTTRVRVSEPDDPASHSSAISPLGKCARCSPLVEPVVVRPLLSAWEQAIAAELERAEAAPSRAARMKSAQ